MVPLAVAVISGAADRAVPLTLIAPMTLRRTYKNKSHYYRATKRLYSYSIPMRQVVKQRRMRLASYQLARLRSLESNPTRIRQRRYRLMTLKRYERLFGMLKSTDLMELLREKRFNR